MYLKLKELSGVQWLYLPSLYAAVLLPRSLPCPPEMFSSQGGVAEDRPAVFQSCSNVWSLGRGGGSCTLHHGSALGHLSVLGCSVLFSWAGAAPALLPVVFGDVVCQPVHFGFPALPQGFVKLHSEVLQCLLISFPKGQGVLEAGGTNQCTTEQVTAQPVRRLFIRNYSIERRNGVAINYF